MSEGKHISIWAKSTSVRRWHLHSVPLTVHSMERLVGSQTLSSDTPVCTNTIFFFGKWHWWWHQPQKIQMRRGKGRAEEEKRGINTALRGGGCVRSGTQQMYFQQYLCSAAWPIYAFAEWVRRGRLALVRGFYTKCVVTRVILGVCWERRGVGRGPSTKGAVTAVWCR